MNPAQQPNRVNGTAKTRKPRPRSTIGINPLDSSPLPLAADEGAPGPPAQAGESDRNDGGQPLFAAWAAGTESVLKAVLDAQNAALRANVSALAASADAQRQLAREWTQAARQAPVAALAAFRAGLQGASPPPAEDERPRKP